VTALIWCLVVVALSGCRAPFDALTDASSRGAARAEELFAALGARVTEPLRDPKYSAARLKLLNAAMIPSRVWEDTTVWTSATATRRSLQVGGRFADGRYRLDASRTVAFPSQPAESRHVIALTRIADDEFAWDTEVPFSIGTISANQFGEFVGLLFASAEGRDEQAIRADYRGVAPRLSAMLGQLFVVDSIRTTQLPDRSTSATFAVTMNPAGVEQRYPNFASYQRRYLMTARIKWTLSDRAGASYLEGSLIDGRLLLKVRTLDGGVVALSGSPRPIPDSLSLNGELSMKVRRFTVGFHDYHGEFTIVRAAHERAIGLVSRQEPKWRLPLLTESLIRTPLRRPFQGRGALFRIGVRDSAGGQTILSRRLHLEVKESAILRFIGRLGSTAVADYQGKAEREQHAWLREVFAALVEDIRAVRYPEESGTMRAQPDSSG
jgi:hypothetical protein